MMYLVAKEYFNFSFYFYNVIVFISEDQPYFFHNLITLIDDKFCSHIICVFACQDINS